MGVDLYDYQKDALKRMHNGCILCGGVGSGKSRTALAYYYILNGGKIVSQNEEYVPMNDDSSLMDLYIITTARKRDTAEWEAEMAHFLIGDDIYNNKVMVDSWNNIKKYEEATNAFFIFDEQRVVGRGQWVKSFLKICKSNRWILLSATPGDTWSDYIPVFIANGFYRNRTEFNRRHAVFSRYTKFPKIERYLDQGILIKHRNDILVDMDFKRPTMPHHEDLICEYDVLAYKDVTKFRWNYEKNKPIENAGELCYALRKVVNSDISRIAKVEKIVKDKGRVIVFYNFNYELELLKAAKYGNDISIAEWNGHKHEPIPDTDKWVYLVQYTAGAEGWNCILTDTIIFYSQNYSYKIMKQSAGRIDRLNTPYKDLYFYHLKSRSGIDIAIGRALKSKKNFNEKKFIGEK